MSRTSISEKLVKTGAICLVLFLTTLVSCRQERADREFTEESNIIHTLNRNLTEAILQDGFSPPVASRIYAYSNIAAYESLRHAGTEYSSLSGQLNQLAALPAPDPELSYDFRIVMVVAFSEVAKELVYRDYIIDTMQVKLLDECKTYSGGSEEIENSLALGHAIAEHIVKWSADDGYNESRNYPIYTPLQSPGSWVPTPPTYKDAIEPYWGQLRTFIIDSASQFPPLPPDEFSVDTGSVFYQAAYDVYTVVKDLDSTQLKIAKHWDCNPSVSLTTGHLMYTKRQLTPGGHWMGVTRLVGGVKEIKLSTAVEAYTRVSIGLADGFISAWDEKFRSNLIRPETYINQHIDENWRPVLETPMFPEHTSAHSVISASVATILTDLFGDGFQYTDSVNVPFGLPPRSFESFHEAAKEAAESRLYGGIHYRPAIDYGLDQGNKIGEFILDNLQTRTN